MAGDPENLIESAARRLPDDSELKLLAGKELQGLLDEQGHALNGGTSPELDRWNKADAKRRRMIGRWLLISLILLISILSFVSWQKEFVFYVRQWFPSGHWLNSETLQDHRERQIEEMKARPWTPEQELLLFGDVSRESSSEAKKALWESESSNPSYYMEYVKAHYAEKKLLPSDYLATAANIDPDNAALIYIAAAVQAEEAVKGIPRSSTERRARKPVEWEITDATKVEMALALSETAGSKPHFDFREGQLAAERAALLAQGSRMESGESMNLIYSGSFLSFSLRPLSEVYQAKARWCVLNAKPNEFMHLLGSMERFYQLQSSSEHPLLIDLLLLENTAHATYACFERSATSLGLSKEAERLRLINEQLQRRYDHRRSISTPARTKKIERESFSHRLLLNPIQFDEHLLRPGIRRDHAFAARLFAVCLAGLTGFAALLFFLARFLSPPLVRGLSSRFTQLFSMRDHLYILALGMMLPAGFTWMISSSTLFGIEYWGVDDSLPVLPITHLVATFLLAMGMSIITARWRLGGMAPAFGFTKRIRWFEWAAVLLAAIYIPVIGWRTQAHQPELKEIGFWSLLLVPLFVCIIIFAARIPLGDFRERIAKAAVARELIPICGWSIVSFLLLGHLLKFEENRWHRRYTWGHFTSENSGPTVAEAFVARQLQAELQEALGIQR